MTKWRRSRLVTDPNYIHPGLNRIFVLTKMGGGSIVEGFTVVVAFHFNIFCWFDATSFLSDKLVYKEPGVIYNQSFVKRDRLSNVSL